MNQKSFGALLRRRAADTHHRYLILVSGEESWRINTARGLLDQTDHAWISDLEIAGVKSIRTDRTAQLLGQETNSVVYECGQRIDATALGIASGTIAGGGMLILLIPPYDQWTVPSESRFHARIFRLLTSCDSVIRVTQGEQEPDINKYTGANPLSSAPTSGIAATPDQGRAIDAIHTVISGQRKRPAVLIADRGRGKSAALGIAAAQLLNGKLTNILVTGHSRKAVQSVFDHAAANSEQTTLGLHWISPDQLLRQLPECDLLLIDEAASIHLHKLAQLLKRYPRIAMATTVHGYEGTGRGFMLRFNLLLDKLTRGWKQIQLEAPIRWSPHDPLEKLINNILVLDADLPDIDPEDFSVGACRVEKVDPGVLADNEQILREIFSLLVLAHYKTRPKDLEQLLDNPDLKIYRLTLNARSRDKTAAVVLLMDEHGLTKQQGKQIFTGKKRPPGHVLAEILATQLGLPNAATLSMGRIMRIVVHPSLRRHGLGSQLIKTVCEDTGLQYDLIGANFSLTHGLAKFWKRNGFDPVRIGLTKSAEGGSNSAMFLMFCTPRGQFFMDQARQSFAQNLPDQLKTALKDIEPEIVAEILSGENILFKDPDACMLYDAASYCYGIRPAESVPFTLTQFVINGLVSQQIRDAELLVERVIQGKAWRSCSALRGDEGRRQGSQRIHRAISTYLEQAYPSDLEAIRSKLTEGNSPTR